MGRLTISDKEKCDNILRYGKILDDREWDSNITYIRQYIIEYEKEIYVLIKKNGIWVDYDHLIQISTHDLEFAKCK